MSFFFQVLSYIYVYSMTLCAFQEHPGQSFLVVGTAQNMDLVLRTCSAAFLCVYRLTHQGHILELVHKVREKEGRRRGGGKKKGSLELLNNNKID
jgi:hypothetical protein